MKTKAYAVAVAIQVILASTVLVSKAAFNRGLSPFVYIFYRMAAASLFLTPLAILQGCVRVLHNWNKCFGIPIKFFLLLMYNGHGTIYAISSDFSDRMTTQLIGLMFLLSERF